MPLGGEKNTIPVARKERTSANGGRSHFHRSLVDPMASKSVVGFFNRQPHQGNFISIPKKRVFKKKETNKMK